MPRSLASLAQSGISRTRWRFLTNPVRRLLFVMARPYFAALLREIHRSTGQGATGARAEAARGVDQKIIDTLVAQQHALSDRLATMEARRVTRAREDDAQARETQPARPDAPASYSQAGEDRICAYVLGRIGIAIGSVRYLDVGAALPVGDNNTFLFYEAGARGVLVEADPEYVDQYARDRPRDTVLQGAVVPAALATSGSIRFHRTADRGWSTVLDERAALARELGKDGSGGETLTVPTLSLGGIIEEHFSATGLDLLSVDIEGLDAAVLDEVDFDAAAPHVVIVENTFEPEGNRFTVSEVPALQSAGYTHYASTHINAIWISPRAVARLTF